MSDPVPSRPRGADSEAASGARGAANGQRNGNGDDHRFMSVRQVAEYLQVNEKKIYALASEGRIPGTKITGKWLFPRDLVDQWLLESSHGGVLTDRLVLAGSDDPLLHRVLGHLAAEVGARAFYSYTPTGTRLGLSLLSSGRADACALHWGPVEESHLRHPALISSFQQHHQWVLVRAFKREQGLMFSPRIAAAAPGVEALLGGRHRWVMRQEGAGSQRFLHEVLARHDTEMQSLEAVAQAHSEHEAAAAIAMDVGDVAPGVRAAARSAGLAFVPIGWEAFDFALYRGIYFRTLFQRLLDELKAPQTLAVAKLLGGYDLNDVGKLVWASQE